MKRILVTGGMGFIGLHLVKRLLDDGHSVQVVDDESSSTLAMPQLLALWGSPGADRLTYDITDVESYCSRHYAFHQRSFDEIYHLASPVGPAGVLQHAGQMVERITLDSYAVMRFARRRNARLVFVSTSEVYGGGQAGYCREDMPRIIQAETTVRLEYAVAKLAAETALINTCRATDLQAVIVRPFNVAGAYQNIKGGFVLPRFVDAALRNDTLTVFGSGQQVRAFTHVRDIADGLVLAMERGQSGSVYNLGNPANRSSILDLARRVVDYVGQGKIVTNVDGRSIYGPLWADAPDKYPDAARAFTELGWKPGRGIEETIADVVSSMKLPLTV